MIFEKNVFLCFSYDIQTYLGWMMVETIFSLCVLRILSMKKWYFAGFAHLFILKA